MDANENEPHNSAPPDTAIREELHVDRLAAGGDGVGRIDGKVVFVPGGLPGEQLVIKRTEDKRRFARAEIVEVLRPAAARRSPDCPHETEAQHGIGCGGCGFRHVSDAQSLQFKTEPVVTEMAKIAPEVDWPQPTLHQETELDGTRWRVRFHLASGVLGLFQNSG
jgi:23S rRNA (uracil1939-C5)-methyltransferase